ncbi:glycosyl hydrolase 115 family protein [Flavobacteriaceae bacterium SZ-1-7]|uniref:glycosyl hydrolase 115 family protein n=1 Tax=Tamlana sedimenti TaxID=3134126 RepID=UPI0031242E9D
MKDKFCFLLLISFLALNSCKDVHANKPSKDTFEIFTSTNKSVILYNKTMGDLDSITAYLFADDVFKITGYRPEVISNINDAKGNVIVIGGIESDLVGHFFEKAEINSNFKNQWESYCYKTILNPNDKIEKAFVVAGTDPRGTAYGVFNLSKQMGVSPWYWWADVPIEKQEELTLAQADLYSKEPTVKYRGIFLNDEDWGLQPWAAKTFEPETGDIGPKTYAKIFELLLRLNANTIWPAMHPSTKAFFHYPNNIQVAQAYNIVVGTSHAEPMLRNNVDEWSKEKHGDFNYKTNKNTIYSYWENRVEEAKNIDAIYTMGMRGVHDSGMEGVNSKDEAVGLLDGILKDQREMLKKHINQDISKIPQAFTVYKEVLDLYKNGLEVPEDVTLVWTDDNYGYIKSLSNAEEQKRSGGSGVYYHASYWGRPHDYLWLGSTNPYLIWEEMIKAYNLNNKNIWILNVGDIKPLEYDIQLFLDIAYDASKFENSESIKEHQQAFFSKIFGEEHGKTMAEIKTDYYQLAFERRPEFMGWSQTEPTTQISNTDYNAFYNADEIEKRIAEFNLLENEIEAIEDQLSDNLKSTFTQLVAYPIKGASNINKKFLYRDKALAYAKQGRLSAEKYKELSKTAYQNIEVLTRQYNELSEGKWNGIMDMKPRTLPVFDNPEIELKWPESDQTIGISIEDTLKTSEGLKRLPTFYVNDSIKYFIDIFLEKNAKEDTWQIKHLPNWLEVTKTSGNFNISKDYLEDRIYVSINWDNWKKAGEPNSGSFTIQKGSSEESVQILISKSYDGLNPTDIVEKNGFAVVYAENFSENTSSDTLNWKRLEGLGHSKAVMQALPLSAASILNHEKAPVLKYEFFTETLNDTALLNLTAIPTHPLNTDGDVRIAIQWNNNLIEIVGFKTKGRSPEWKQNVLRNKASKQITVPLSTKGKQTLKIYMIDPGVLLDYFVLNTSGSNSMPYKLPNETKIGNN